MTNEERLAELSRLTGLDLELYEVAAGMIYHLREKGKSAGIGTFMREFEIGPQLAGMIQLCRAASQPEVEFTISEDRP